MRTRFYLEKRKGPDGKIMTGECPVLMSVTFNGERVMLGSGIRVEMEGWDPLLQRVKLNYPDAPGLNNWLETMQDTAQKTWSVLISDGLETGAKRFREVFRQLKPSFSTGFFQVFYSFLESGYARWSMSTYRKVRTIYNHLREFENVTGYSISFRSLDENFLREFISFYAEKGNNSTTTRKAVNILVWFLNWATGKGYNIYTGYRRFYRILTIEPDTDTRKPLCLRWQELMSLLEFRPPDRKMERTRDLFCFMCFSGLRFSEIQSLRKEDINDREILARSKRGRIRKLPMNRYTREIYNRYENRFYRENTAFPTMSIITFNKYLRLIGKLVGFENDLSGCLTAGIAVNTFIINALELEIPVEIISSFTGVNHDRRIRQIKAHLAKEEMKKFG